jgi:hypothetical protein
LTINYILHPTEEQDVKKPNMPSRKNYVTTRTDTTWQGQNPPIIQTDDPQTALAGISFGEEELFVYKTLWHRDKYYSVRSKNKMPYPRKMKSPRNTDGIHTLQKKMEFSCCQATD